MAWTAAKIPDQSGAVVVTGATAASAWGLVAEGVADHHARLRQRPEHVDVEAFVADAAVERLDAAVAPGLAGRDEVQAGAFATIDTILTGRPSVVASDWKSTAHKALGASATGTVPAVEAPRRLRRRR